MLAPEEISLPSSDPTAYYAYVCSSLIDGDLDFRNDYQGRRLRPLALTPTGLYHNPQPVGPALLWAPFFLLAHVVTGIVNAVSTFEVYARDGRETIYLKAVALGSGVFVWGGWLACYLWARCLFNRHTVRWSMLVLGFTPLVIVFLYGMPILSHPASFLLASWVFLLWFGARKQPCPGRFLLLGVLIGLACIIRYQNGALLLFPGWTLAAFLWQSGPGLKHCRKTILLCGAGLLLGYLVGVLPQLVIWKVLQNRWLAMPYSEQMRGTYFHFLNPQISLALFSHPRYFNSLFPWVPAAFLALCGFVWLWKRDRELTALALLFFLIQLYTTATTRQMARLEGRANHLLIRRFDSCLPLLILGLAAFGQRVFTWLKKDALWPWRPLAMVVTLILCLDGWMMAHAPALWHLKPAHSVDSWALHGRNFELLLQEPERALSLHLILGQLQRSWHLLLALAAFAAVAFPRRRRSEKGVATTPSTEEMPQDARLWSPRWLAWIAAHRDWLLASGLMLYLLLWATYLWRIGPVRPPLG